MDGTRSDTYNTTVKIAGVNLGTWDVMSGGQIDSAELKYKPGAMGPEVSLGGSKTTENVTLRRLYDLPRDHAKSQWYINQVGKAAVVITKQPLDVDGNTWGDPLVYKGILKRVKFPDHDSQSNEAGLIEIEVTISGDPAGMS